MKMTIILEGLSKSEVKLNEYETVEEYLEYTAWVENRVSLFKDKIRDKEKADQEKASIHVEFKGYSEYQKPWIEKMLNKLKDSGIYNPKGGWDKFMSEYSDRSWNDIKTFLESEGIYCG